MNPTTILALGYVGGIAVHLLDRVSFILAEGQGKSLGGFLRQNWARLGSRGIVAFAVFVLAVENGWFQHWFAAACVGLAIDKVTESLLDRMKKGGEAMAVRMRNGHNEKGGHE